MRRTGASMPPYAGFLAVRWPLTDRSHVWSVNAVPACGDAMAGLSFDSDVPWHRVIHHRGRISPRAGIGSELQQQRLEKEGVLFNQDGSIDLGQYRWKGQESGYGPP